MIAGLGMWWLVGSGQSSSVLPNKASNSAHTAAANFDTTTGISIVMPDAITGVAQGAAAQAQQVLRNLASNTTASIANTQAAVADATKTAIDNAFVGAVGQGENLLGISGTISLESEQAPCGAK